MYKFDREAYDRRMEWYRDARFGMFIHWGLYAIPARGEWVRSSILLISSRGNGPRRRKRPV